MLESRKPYVLTVLVNPQAPVEEQQAIESLARSWVEEHQGAVVDIAREPKRTLAYPIKHARQANFTHLRFDLPPQELHDLRDKIARQQAVLRLRIQQKAARGEGKTLRDVPPLRGTDAPKAPLAPKKEKVGLEKLDEKIEEILEEKVL